MMLLAAPPINISDIIGFIIAFIAFLYMVASPFLKKRPVVLEQTDDDEDEYEYAMEEEEQIVMKKKPQPKLVTNKKWDDERFKFKTNIEKRTKPTAIEQRSFQTQIAARTLKDLEASFENEISSEDAYAIKEKEKPSLAELILNENLRHSIIAMEMLNKPRGLRNYDGRPYGL